MGLHVLGCRVDILGTNCNRLLQISRPAIYMQAMPGKSQVTTPPEPPKSACNMAAQSRNTARDVMFSKPLLIKHHSACQGHANTATLPTGCLAPSNFLAQCLPASSLHREFSFSLSARYSLCIKQQDGQSRERTK